MEFRGGLQERVCVRYVVEDDLIRLPVECSRDGSGRSNSGSVVLNGDEVEAQEENFSSWGCDGARTSGRVTPVDCVDADLEPLSRSLS